LTPRIKTVENAFFMKKMLKTLNKSVDDKLTKLLNQNNKIPE